jgi:glycosyltransferase involved in cell wall biosynthesis
MKVATIYTLYGRRAGAEMCFEKALEAIRALRPDIHWTVFCNREAQAQLARIFPDLPTTYVPWLDSQFKKAYWLEFLSASVLAEAQPDLFWVPSGCNSFPGRWKEVPTVTTFLDLGEYRVKGKYDFKRTVFRKRICIPRAVKRSAAFIAISRFTADDMARFLNVRENVSVVYCGPSPHVPRRRADAEKTLAEGYGLVPRKYFFVPGRTDFIGKGLDLILEAQDRLGRDWPPSVQVVFVGPPGDGHARFLTRLNQSDPAGDRLKYLGRVDDDVLGALYQECLATVLPSRFEGFGFPVLEAMDYGVPVLCSDAGSLPEVAGGGALLFRSGDLHDLCLKLQQVADDTALREQLIREGRTRSQAFSWEACGKGMLEVFDRVGATSQRG